MYVRAIPRPRNGTFYFNRANGGSTVFGPTYYNIFNFGRVGKMGKVCPSAMVAQ